jgi:carotenoid cleavage dioxygenase
MTVVDAWQTPFLQGLMAPVFDERDDVDLEVVGEIPAALRGMFVRTGPNQQFAPLGAYHPFDGDGMLHAVYLEDGKARYRNRWVESKGLLAERARGHALYGGMGSFQLTDPDAARDVGMMKNTGNTATVRHAGHLFTILEACPPTEFDRDLNTLGEYDYDGRLQGPMTAHPKVDPVSGEMLFFGYSPVAPYLRYSEVDAGGELVHTTEIDLPAPVMMHDFVITQNHAVFFDAPAVFDLGEAMTGGDPLSWKPENGTRIGIIPRRGTNADVRWFEIDNGFVVHFFNAWETGNTIEIRAPRMEDMPGGFSQSAGAAREPLPWRWVIDLTTGKVTEGQTDDLAGEFPRVPDQLIGLPTRFGYACPQRTWDFEFDFEGVIKFDFENGTSQAHYYGDSEVSGEHVFAPDPAGTAEDDGWLMSFVSDRATETSELVILDARDVEGEPVARIKMAARVPIGFHANWFAD